MAAFAPGELSCERPRGAWWRSPPPHSLRRKAQSVAGRAFRGLEVSQTARAAEKPKQPLQQQQHRRLQWSSHGARVPMASVPRRGLAGAGAGRQHRRGGRAAAAAAEPGPAPEACLRREVAIGAAVEVVAKEDQRTGRRTRGRVQDILTNAPEHPRGMKVRLAGGVVGRVHAVLGREGQAPAPPPRAGSGVAQAPPPPKGAEEVPSSRAEQGSSRGTPFAALLGLKAQMLEEGQLGQPTADGPRSKPPAGSAPDALGGRERQQPGPPREGDAEEPLGTGTKGRRPPRAQQGPTDARRQAGAGGAREQATPSGAPAGGTSDGREASAALDGVRAEGGGASGREAEGTRRGRTSRGTAKGGKGRAAVGGASEVFVHNLSREVTEEEFARVMSGTPGVVRWRFMGPEAGQAGPCRGFGFCTAADSGAVQGITEHLERVSLHGKPWRAKLSAPGGKGAGGEIGKLAEQPKVKQGAAEGGRGSGHWDGPLTTPGGSQQKPHNGSASAVGRRNQGSTAGSERMLDTLRGLQQSEHASSGDAPGLVPPSADPSGADSAPQHDRGAGSSAIELQAGGAPRTAGEQILAAMEQAARERALGGGGGDRMGRRRGKVPVNGAAVVEDGEGQRPVRDIVLNPTWETRLIAARSMLEDVERSSV